MKLLVIFTLFFGLALGSDDIVTTSQGKLKGSTLISRNGRKFNAFQGIPYAKPPINDLRFKDPVVAEPWDNVLNATTEKNMCIQKNLFVYGSSDILTGDEDCLYLNVYTPKIPNNKNKLYPVMVWIAGGGYSSGQGGLSLYGPHYLLDKDVVVVTFNYRLGIFGFLSTEDDHLPGNYGMKDQVLALKWVKKNIDKFGGDPNSVTIFGESAGGASVGLHLLSPLSKGLFHKAIMESGTPLVRWGVSPPGWARRRAEALSTIAGCSNDLNEMASCLRLLPAELLVDLLYNFFEWSIHPSIIFMPVVENCNKEGSFLCKYPLLDFKQESNVPVLMGMNSGEGGIFAARMYNKSNDFVDFQLQKNFNEYASSLLIYKYTTKSSDLPVVGKKIYDRYFPDGKMDNPFNVVKMISGGIFLQGVLDMATNLTSPVYYYIYGHQNTFSYNTFFGPCTEQLGVTHGDEMTSLFYSSFAGPLKGEDLHVSILMIDFWTRFVSNEQLIVDAGKAWPVFDKEYMKYVLIDSSRPTISEKPFIEEYEFWNSLPLLSGVKKSESLLQKIDYLDFKIIKDTINIIKKKI